MIKVGIVGATGYAGAELVRLLLQRDDIKIVGYGSKSFAGESYSGIFRNMQMTSVTTTMFRNCQRKRTLYLKPHLKAFWLRI